MARFKPGDRVRVKANPARQGMVDQAFQGDEGHPAQYQVFFSADDISTYPEASLALSDEFDAPAGPVELLKRWHLGNADQFRSFLTLAKLTTPVANNLYSFLASRTELLPYQFRPVLKLIDSPYSRLLIADEVGLGKTIEAGIVVTELNARTPTQRVLVVCPSTLTGKWRRELSERFELDFEVLDGQRFRDELPDLAAGDDRPWRRIASLESLRRIENLELIAEQRPRLDAVIVDEAHHMRNQTTLSYALGENLSDLADTMLFLTATPLNLGERDFFNLLRLLVPEEFHDFETFPSVIEPNDAINSTIRALRRHWPPDFAAVLEELTPVERGAQRERFLRNSRYRTVRDRLVRAAAGDQPDRDEAVELQRTLAELNTLAHVFTRTKKREVSEHFPTRRAHRLSVDLTESESGFYEAVTRWARHLYEESDMPVGFVTVAFQRQAASCIPAMGAKLAESLRLGEVSFFDEELTDMDSSLLLSMGPAHGDGDPLDEGDVRALGVALSPTAADLIKDLAQAWEQTRGVDTKYDVFEQEIVRMIRQGVEKILVFSFFIRTIEYLEERLEALKVDGVQPTVLKIYGKTQPAERHDVIRRFRTGQEPQILISSEVGSEGLDFQFCSAMVNYDLPWNPMRVEQRIGRLDRYGQESELIEISNLVVNDTIEDRIFYRLYERIGIFERSIGDLEAILGNELRDLQRDVLRRSLTPEEETRRANQISDAIIRRQQEHEEFDEQSKRFLGIDDVLADRFHDIQESERYITAGDLQNFLEQFLARRFRRVHLKKITDRPKSFELVNSADSDFVEFVRVAYARGPDRSRQHLELINRLNFGEELVLTFDAQQAMIDRDIEFFSLHHPIIRAAVFDLRESEELPPTGHLAVHDPDLGEPLLFFLFELRSRGIRDEVELIGAAVRRDGTLDEQRSLTLLNVIREAELASGSLEGLISDELVDTALGVARSWAGEQVARRQQELEQTVNEAIDAQLESLRISHQRREASVDERLQNAIRQGEHRIQRMHRSQLSNLHRHYEERVRDLESKRGVEIGHRIVAAGLMTPTINSSQLP